MTGGGSYTSSKTKCYDRLGFGGAGASWKAPMDEARAGKGSAGCWHYPLKNEDAQLRPSDSDKIATMESGYDFGRGEDGADGQYFADKSIAGIKNGRGGGGGGWYGGFSDEVKAFVNESVSYYDENYYGGGGGSAYGNKEFIFHSPTWNSSISSGRGISTGDGRVRLRLKEEIPLATVSLLTSQPITLSSLG